MDQLDIAQIANLIEEITSTHDLQQFKASLLGRNGTITNELKNLKDLPNDQKATQGKKLNEKKIEIENLFEIKQEKLESAKKIYDKTDFTVPQKIKLGTEHIISYEIARLHELFAQSGFEHIIGPDIENAFYNFEALNMPLSHPARDNQDTFYMQTATGTDDKQTLLRTHTTSAQVRLLESMNGNLHETRSYSIGRVYRNDTHDATHASSFHQIEGVILEKDITIEHLKGFLEHIMSQFFEKAVKIRLRPSYFPFTEPSCELDIFTKTVDGKRIVSEEGQPMEIGGCGVIHPTIMQRFGAKDDSLLGIAFGMGLERWIMIKHGLTNLHDMYDNHIPTLQKIIR